MPSTLCPSEHRSSWGQAGQALSAAFPGPEGAHGPWGHLLAWKMPSICIDSDLVLMKVSWYGREGLAVLCRAELLMVRPVLEGIGFICETNVVFFL